MAYNKIPPAHRSTLVQIHYSCLLYRAEAGWSVDNVVEEAVRKSATLLAAGPGCRTRLRSLMEYS